MIRLTKINKDKIRVYAINDAGQRTLIRTYDLSDVSYNSVRRCKTTEELQHSNACDRACDETFVAYWHGYALDKNSFVWTPQQPLLSKPQVEVKGHEV